MMTFVAAQRIAKHFHLDLHTTYMRVTLTAIDVIGTLAELEIGEWLNLYDLLQGLMLPSGNDCANVIAENLGALLFFDKMGEKNMLNGLKSIDLSEDYSNIRLYTDTFVRYMNSIARELNMRSTLFSNPHGLSGREHYSSAEDMALLSAHLLNVSLVEQFIECRSHEAKIKISNNNQITIRSAVWENTNKLLEKPGFKGIKTGHTVNAGGCLSSYYINPLNGERLIIVVMGCKSQEARFSDTEATLELL
jgi:D-alanyl-D-alanine carboxypeptidase (penicillin-binding protein 5/6)